LCRYARVQEARTVLKVYPNLSFEEVDHARGAQWTKLGAAEKDWWVDFYRSPSPAAPARTVPVAARGAKRLHSPGAIEAERATHLALAGGSASDAEVERSERRLEARGRLRASITHRILNALPR
jgi:hypothetical protein